MSLNHFMNLARINLKPDDQFVALKIYDGTIRRQLSTFLICRDKLAEVAEGTAATMVDTDLNNTLRVYRAGKDELKFTLYYVRHEDDLGRFEGLAERFTLPVSDILQVLVLNSEITRLIHKNQPLEQARIELSFNAHRAIKELCKNPIEKRALSKALRDNFMYGKNEEVFLTTDFDGFFFTDERISGGLIRDARPVYGSDGYVYTGIYYSVHT